MKTIRQLKEQGKKEAADRVKNNLHAGTFCTTFKNLLRSSIYQQYNNLMVIDITSNTYILIATVALFIINIGRYIRSINNNGNYTCSCHLYDYHNIVTIYSSVN